MNLACCTWALAGADREVLQRIADLGCRWIDIQPGHFTAAESLAAIKELGLSVSCMSLSFGIPAGVTLDSADETARITAVQHAIAGIDRGAKLGARTAYIIPGMDSSKEGLARYADSLAPMARHADQLGIRLGIEHFPGRGLPTIAATLGFIAQVGEPNLHLLLDVGHAQMTNEPIPAAIRAAGDRLCYVHLDDNDGVHDLHWALLDGVMTEQVLAETFRTLREVGYSGAISLEISPNLTDPLDAVQRSWAITQRIITL
jgi:sugar phosphate isomerase/epimerase